MEIVLYQWNRRYAQIIVLINDLSLDGRSKHLTKIHLAEDCSLSIASGIWHKHVQPVCFFLIP